MSLQFLNSGRAFFIVIISDKSSVSVPDKSFSKDEHRFRYSPAFPLPKDYQLDEVVITEGPPGPCEVMGGQNVGRTAFLVRLKRPH